MSVSSPSSAGRGVVVAVVVRAGVKRNHPLTSTRCQVHFIMEADVFCRCTSLTCNTHYYGIYVWCLFNEVSVVGVSCYETRRDSPPLSCPKLPIYVYLCIMYILGTMVKPELSCGVSNSYTSMRYSSTTIIGFDL